MAKGKLSDAQVAARVESLRRDYAPHVARLRTRRLLLDIISAVTNGPDNQTGTNVPPPFDKQSMILLTRIGEPIKEAQRWASRIAANTPQVVAVPIVDGDNVPKGVEALASKQERLLMAMFDAVDGATMQQKLAWSQSWGRVGYYVTLPCDAALGLPDREYYDDLPEDEIAYLKEQGKAVETPTGRYAEAAGSWVERRRTAARDAMVAGTTLNTLEAFPPDVVYPRRDSKGIRECAIILEIPHDDCGPGSDLALKAARHDGYDGEDAHRYSLLVDSQGKVIGGIPAGGEPGSTTSTAWTLAIYLTRDEVYYLVSQGSGGASAGKVVWCEEHGDGEVPVFDVPFFPTDSMRPGGEATSPMEAMFALAPIINQIETLLSNVAAYNAIPRWVVELPDGKGYVTDEDDNIRVFTNEPTPGLDPSQAIPVGGKIVQLKIDADLLFNLLQFYVERMDHERMPEAITGAAGDTGPAWGKQLMIEQAHVDIKPAVENHARAWQKIWRLWMRRAKRLDVPIFAYNAPGKSRDRQYRRGLIEFNPQDFIETISVHQSSYSQSDAIVRQQAGIELYTAKLIDLRQLYEDYFLEQDPRDAEIRMYVQLVKNHVLLGDVTSIMPGSLLANVAASVQGRAAMEVIARSQNAALAQAEAMAMQAQMTAQLMTQQSQQQIAPPTEGGNPANAVGAKQPGMGMGLSLPEPGNGMQRTAPAPVGV
jgi:hypothetical protein